MNIYRLLVGIILGFSVCTSAEKTSLLDPFVETGNEDAHVPLYKSPQKNSMLIIIYMAARNDLSMYSKRHINQLKNVGCTDKVKVFVHIDMQDNDDRCFTKHFFVEKNKLSQVGPETNMDSGNEETLYSTVKTAYNLFPADNVVLILSNHGTGAIEPDVTHITNSADLYRFNSETGKIELDESIGYLDHISQGETAYNETKGICFDDSTGNYLTIAKLTRTLERITREILKKKIKVLACDACTMAQADVFIGLHPYADYFVASQEVESGLGYKYDMLLKPVMEDSITADMLPYHLVTCYEEFYKSRICDYYTQSAIDLSAIGELETTIDEIAQCLIQGLEDQKNKSVKEAIRLSRHENNCKHFREPTYIDLGDFYSNLLKNITSCTLNTEAETNEFRKKLTALLIEGIKIIRDVVIAKCMGEKHKKASGISIYFPQHIIHKSYNKNPFATKTHWLKFLKRYVSFNK